MRVCDKPAHVAPVVQYPMYLQPLRPDSVPVKPILQVVQIFLDLLLVTSVRAAVLQRRRLIHVILPDVVAVHRRMMNVQLETRDITLNSRTTSSDTFALR